MFGVGRGARVEVEEFTRQAREKERYALECVLRGEGEYHDVLVAVRTSGGRTFHVRAVCAKSLLAGDLTVGTMMTPT